MLNDENNTVDSMSVENFANKIADFYRKYGEQIGFSYTPNNKLLQEQNKLKNRLKNINDFNLDLDKIYPKLHNQYKSNKLMLDDYEWSMLNIDRNVNYMRIMIELLKINNEKLIFYNEKNKSGVTSLLDIAKKIGYKSKTQKRFIKNLFYIEFRNALSHMDYYYKLNNNEKFEFIWIEKIKTTNSINECIEHTLQLDDMKSIMMKILVILNAQGDVFNHIMKINTYALIIMSDEKKVHMLKNYMLYV